MIISYDKNDGHFNYTIDNVNDTNGIKLNESEAIMVSCIEYGSTARYMKRDINTGNLILRKGVMIKSDKDKINAGESIHFTILTNQGFEPLNLKIGDNIFNVTTSEFDVTFDCPGIYYIQIPNFDYYCMPKMVEVV
jgi:hypothetical protein